MSKWAAYKRLCWKVPLCRSAALPRALELVPSLCRQRASPAERAAASQPFRAAPGATRVDPESRAKMSTTVACTCEHNLLWQILKCRDLSSRPWGCRRGDWGTVAGFPAVRFFGWESFCSPSGRGAHCLRSASRAVLLCTCASLLRSLGGACSTLRSGSSCTLRAPPTRQVLSPLSSAGSLASSTSSSTLFAAALIRGRSSSSTDLQAGTGGGPQGRLTKGISEIENAHYIFLMYTQFTPDFPPWTRARCQVGHRRLVALSPPSIAAADAACSSLILRSALSLAFRSDCAKGG